MYFILSKIQKLTRVFKEDCSKYRYLQKTQNEKKKSYWGVGFTEIANGSQLNLGRVG